MDLTPYQRQDMQRCLEAAPTLLENLLWGWLLGFPQMGRIYFEELIISDLEGPGDEPDDTVGVSG